MKQSHAALSRRMKRYVGDIHAIQHEFKRSWSGSQYDYRWAISHLGKRKKTSRSKIIEFLRGEKVLFPPPERPKEWLENFFIWENVPDSDIRRIRPSDPLQFTAGTVSVRIRINYIYKDKQVLDYADVRWEWDGKRNAKVWHYRCRNHVRDTVDRYFRAKGDSPTGVIELFRCTIKEHQHAGAIHAGESVRDSKKGKELSGKHIRQRNKKHHGGRPGRV